MAFYQQKATKHEMLKQYGVSSNEIYQEDFLKVAVLTALRKEQRSDPFVEYPVHSLLLAESEQKWNA